jgi:DNA-binding MarR family transcriptional regulator
MPTKRNTQDLTPAGGLGEGRIHGLLGYQLAQATIVTTEAFLRVVGKPMNLRPVEFTILDLLHENAAVTTTQLARALAMTGPGVAAWIERLEARGLLSRERSESDRRAQQLRLTRRGTDLVVKALGQLLAEDSELLAHLTDGERRILLELLHKVAVKRTRR